MREQRSSLGNFCETFEIGSTSGSLPVDEQGFWRNVPHVPVEDLNFPIQPLSSADRMSSENASRQTHSVSNFWNVSGPSSNPHLLNESHQNDSELNSGWRSSIASTSRSGPSVEESRPEGVNMLPLVHGGIDLNSSQVDHDQAFTDMPNLNRCPDDSCYSSGHVGMNSQVPQSELSHQPSDLGFLQPQNGSSIMSSDISRDSSRAIQFFPDNGVSGQTIPSGGHSFSQKRKSVAGNPGQSSTCGSHSSAEPSQGNTITPTGINQIMTSDHDHFGASDRNEQCFQRNTRMRIIPPCPSVSSAPNLWPQGNVIGHPNLLPGSQSVSPATTSHHSFFPSFGANTSSPYIQSPEPVVGLSSNVQSFTCNGEPSMGVGSSNSLAIEGGRSTTVETNPGTVLRNNHQTVVPLTNTRNLTNTNRVASGNARSLLQSGNSTGVQQLPRVNSTSSQNHRHEIEGTHLPVRSSVSESRSHGLDLGPNAGQSPSSHEIGTSQTRSVSHGYPQPIMRPPYLMGRQHGGVLGIPSGSSLAVIRENRRVLSQLRNMLDQARRGDISIQDVLYYDQHVFLGGYGVFDRHIDMQVDVDNMSYEELLALEEQIGDVSTGLPDEKIIECLKQRKYISLMPEPSEDVEPCSICQEEYVEGEDVGRLDCGHDFHVACIKKWLAIKNLCPICKTTALSSAGK